jgi:flagellum-specific peptidoglycan hydrolase FlgJ
MKPQDFIDAIAPAAKQSAITTKIPASFTTAEAALESGWGASMLAQQAHNLFGVKADSSWHGPTWTMQTREYLRGQWVMVPALWRAYPDWLGSISDHAQFLLTNPRYKPCFQYSDGEGFAQACQNAGYATDPQYASKIISIIRAHKLALLDCATHAE